jgi:hypothetical protein
VSEIATTDAQILARWATLAGQLNSITHDMAGLFVEGAKLGKRNEKAIRTHFPTWSVTHRLLEAAARYADDRTDVLKRLLDQSDARLDPLRDPLRMTFSLHRWMADDREEAYSDWLAWVLTELASPERIGRVLFGDSISEHSVLKFFQVDKAGMFRMTSSARYFKEGVGSSRPHWRWIICFLDWPKTNISCKAWVKWWSGP